MTAWYLLDTAIVSSPISKRANAGVLKKLRENGHECAIGAPVWNELRYGCERMAKGKRRAALETYLSDVVLKSFTVLSYDQAAAQWHGVERARLEKLGTPAPFVDGQIAAIAHVHALTLITTNVRDFSRFMELKIDNWAT